MYIFQLIIRYIFNQGLEYSRDATTNFSWQGRFLGIKTTWQTFQLQHTKQRPRRENLQVFLDTF